MKPQRYLTYNGDTTDVIGQVVGPNEFGEFFTAVTADYDPATNKTRVGFALRAPEKK